MAFLHFTIWCFDHTVGKTRSSFRIAGCRSNEHLQPWTYCLGNFPRSPVQCWMYERNRCTRISTPTFETKVVGSSVLGAVVQFSPRNQTWDPFLERPGGAFHLVKNSENSGSGLNGKRFFGSPDRKIPRKSGTTETTF